MNGLTTQQATEALKKYGKNVISTSETTSALRIFLSQFATVINAILGVAAVFSFAINSMIDGAFIVAIIILNACLGFLQEFKAERALEKLKQYASPTARVIRDNKESEMIAEMLVPGDMVVLTEGARITADGTLTQVVNLEVDESILTGESLAVTKQDGNEAFMGTLITKGKAYLSVTKTGMHTRFGQIADTLTTITDEKTPLQKDFSHLGKVLSVVALIAGMLVLPIGLSHHMEFVPLALVAASIAIAAIPEGLPAVITIAFAVGSSRLAKRSAIVRKMAAIETLGAMQVILVDKTGTITQNHMRVKEQWVPNNNDITWLLRSCMLGNTASLIEKGNGTYDIIGDQTDGALLLWATTHIHFPQIQGGSVLDEYVFDATTKTITTLWKKDTKEYVFVRGAPESILEKSNLTEKEKEHATLQYERFARQGQRVIGFAMKQEAHVTTKTREHLEKNLTFLGFISLYDPPRAETKDAVAKAHTAGIQVSMVTGDNELTALSIAKEVGLIEKEEDVMTGQELEKLSDEELAPLLIHTRIFARTRPEQKLRIATLLQKQGFVVGVTGDGVNDALALKKADVGVAMGKSGTDVAKESADVVLADDNFATLIKSVEEGRIIYKNIVNATLYLLSGNLAEVSLVLFATLFNLPFPLLPTQILWINLVTDSLPAIALATGSQDTSVLFKKPRDPRLRLLTGKRILIIFAIGFLLAETLIVVFSGALTNHSETYARTLAFNGLIYLHLLMVIVLGWHSLKKGNVFLITTILLIAIVQIIITYVPFFQQIFHLSV